MCKMRGEEALGGERTVRSSLEAEGLIEIDDPPRKADLIVRFSPSCQAQQSWPRVGWYEDATAEWLPNYLGYVLYPSLPTATSSDDGLQDPTTGREGQYHCLQVENRHRCPNSY